MGKGYKISLSVITIMILITITIGTSYSYYSVSDVQENPNNVSTTCFKINFTDQNPISLTNSYPMAEATALAKTPYQFTITNTCTTGTDIKYDVLLNTLTNPASNLTPYLRYKLEEVGGTAQASAKITSAATYTLASDIKTSESIDTSYKLASGTLAPGASKTYKLYIWIDEDTSLTDVQVSGAMKSFTGKVLVYNYI